MENLKKPKPHLSQRRPSGIESKNLKTLSLAETLRNAESKNLFEV
jgi:hypothetical protein